MAVHGLLVARCYGYRGYRPDEFHEIPGTTVTIEFEMGKEAQMAVRLSTILHLQAVPTKRYHGAQDITSIGNSVRECTNKIVYFQKFEINSNIKANVGHWENIDNYFD